MCIKKFHLSVSLCVCQVCAGTSGGQKRALDSPCSWSYMLLWTKWLGVLGTKLRFSWRTTSALNSWAIAAAAYAHTVFDKKDLLCVYVQSGVAHHA